MNSVKKALLFCLLIFILSACSRAEKNLIPTIEEAQANPSVTEVQPSPLPSTTPVPTNTPLSTLDPTYTPLPPVENPAPTPVPPSETWINYDDPQGLFNFDYPENWYIFTEDRSVASITNFRLDGLQLKGYADVTIKIDIYKTPTDISDFASLADYLSAQEIEEAEDPGEVLSQNTLFHQRPNYQVVSQLHSGLMGLEDETYTRIFVVRDDQVITIIVYGNTYVPIAEQIACSLIFP